MKNKEFGISFVISILSSVIGILFSFAAAKYLEAEIYGQIQYYVSVITLLSSFLVFGSDSFIIKNYQFEGDSRFLLSKIYTFIFLSSSLFLPFYFRIAVSFLDKLNGNSLLIFILFVCSFALSLSTVASAVFQAKNKYQLKTFVSSFLPHLCFLITFLAHLLTKTLFSFNQFYLLYYFVFYGLYGLIFFIKSFRKIKFPNLNELSSIVFLGLSFAFYNIISPLTNIFVGETYNSYGIVAIFSLSYQILTISNIATTVVNNISYTVFAKLLKNKQYDDLFSFYKKVTRITIYLALPFYCAFIFEAGNIFNFFGETYEGFNFVLILLSISALIDTVTGPCGTILQMGGFEKKNFIASFIRFALFFAILIPLIRITVYAAPIASIISTIVANILKLDYLRKFTKINFFS
ncbi:MAG: polysaccharide biosynthesis C-terminal domain-containing protein, partial [Clostridia bacterium]|nr:polysaccharide biosynthesis C-terminal domain-containing protein [Clostridia bacterium]